MALQRSPWWAIRSLRSSPPALAGRDDLRRRVFTAALEQSEQLFTAAASVTTATSPLLAFYGLSQAGRAVLAAHYTSQHWQATGHGVRAIGLDRPLTKVAARDDKGGLFRSVARVMESPSLPIETELGRLIAALPALVEHEPEYDTSFPTVLSLEPEQEHFVITRTITAWVSLPTTVPREREAVTALLAHYPTLGPWQFQTDSPIPLPCRPRDGSWATPIVWTLAPGWHSSPRWDLAVEAHALSPPPGLPHWVVPPALPGNTGPLAPLVHWWALLLALSMLVRYEPATWRAHTDVDGSSDAVGLDAIMYAALRDLPAHILQALVDPTAWKPSAPIEYDATNHGANTTVTAP